MAKGVYVGGHFFLEAELSLDFIVNECAAFFVKIARLKYSPELFIAR